MCRSRDLVVAGLDRDRVAVVVGVMPLSLPQAAAASRTTPR
jgi:hypothetical protein